MNYSYFSTGHTFIRRTLEPGGIRLIAHPSQVILAERFAEPFQLCSVSLLRVGPQSEPEQVLDEMEKVGDTLGRYGGWRMPGPSEMAALCFSRQAAGARILTLPQETLQLLDQHPLILAGVSFAFGGVVPGPLLTLMVQLYDMRRFTDPENPERASRLKSFFRLTNPNAVRRVLKLQHISQDDPDYLTYLCLSTWNAGPLAFLSEAQVRRNPHAFLFRDYFEHRKKYRSEGRREAEVRAAWRTSQRFVVWLRTLWLSIIDQERFDPAQFFRREDEIEEFRAFIRKLDNDLDNSAKPK